MIRCEGCGVRENVSVNDPERVELGYEVLWDISNGLDVIILCKECSNRIYELLKEIEEITNEKIENINFEGYIANIDKR